MNTLIGTEVLPAEDRWAWSPQKPVSGTTKFYVRVAEELARQGHFVFVEWQGPALVHNGVSYGGRFESAPLKADLILDCNYQRPRRFGPEFVGDSRVFLQWTSFYNRPDTCVGDGYDRLLLVSEYVKSTINAHVKAPVTVLELGCDDHDIVYPELASRPKRCCYTSSPDRGGAFLKLIWPEVESATGYELECSPYGEGLTEAGVRAIYERSRFWLYPAIGTDSIISALEAQAAGCIPFYVPHMALPETCRYGIQSDLNRFKQNLIATLNAATPKVFSDYEAKRFRALADRPIPKWKDVAERILRVAGEVSR